MPKDRTSGFRYKIAWLILPLLLLLAAGYGLKSQRAGRKPALPAPALKQLANQHNITVGNFAIRNHLKDTYYTDILTSQFDLALVDNTPNWYFTDGGLRPSKDSFAFQHMDEVVAFAEAHHMPMQAHHFLWGEQKWLPDWLTKGNFTPVQLDDIIKQHIQTVGSHYAGKIQEWTVVNEAFTRNQHIYGLKDWWGDHTGGMDYIDKAFFWAHQADPHAKLILNDFNNESLNETSNAMYDYVKAAKARGVPIDGIGMQMHLDGTHPPIKDEVITNMKRFKELGVDVYITEFDVNMNDLQATPEEKDNTEGRIYYDMARACIESNACKSFAILGITDNETWYNYMGLKDPRPLPFDRKYNPKPAYYSLRDAFSQP